MEVDVVFSVRRARKEDLKSINSLTMQMHNHLGQLVGISFSPDELEDEFYDEADSLDEVLVVEAEGSVVGYLSFTQKIFEDEWCGRYYRLEHLIVDEEHRRKGYGTKLFEAVIQKAKSDDANIVVDTFVRNKVTIEFFRKLGFKPLSTVFVLDMKGRLQL